MAALLDEGDIIIDGGNSNYRDDVRRAKKLREQGIHYVDVGTSGGVFGLERGYCLMVGGDEVAIETIEPILKTIAPGPGELERTPGRSGDLAPEEQGYLHCGPSGAGHFVKMVHNGIEYGMMAAFAEGLNISGQGRCRHRACRALRRDRADGGAGVLPVRHQHRQGHRVVAPRVGRVVLAARPDRRRAAGEPAMEGLAGRVSDSGEGRWTVKAAVDIGVPAPVLAASLFERFASRGEDKYANQVLSAMRQQFGGHKELPAGWSWRPEPRRPTGAGDARQPTEPVLTSALESDVVDPAA